MLTPALVGGAVADERQRGTLTKLLTTDLTGGEIVVGKLLSRLGTLSCASAATLPLLMMLGLFGGVDPVRTALAFAVTLAATAALAATGVCLSTFARQPWVAMLRTCSLAALVWLALPLSA